MVVGNPIFQAAFILLISCSSLDLVTSFATDRFSLSSEEDVFKLFKEWKERHGKTYDHEHEAKKRFDIFRNNLKYIIEKNAARGSHVDHFVGLNKFADMSNEEFKKIYSSKIKKPLKKERTLQGKSSVEKCEAPSALDWRNYGIVTGVKDQGDCGGCWAFSSTGAIEGINALTTGGLISLSEQELIDCDSTNEGCNGGYMDYAFEWVIRNGGIDTESDYPYTGVDGACNTIKEQMNIVSIDSYHDVQEKESALLCAVANQPVSVGIDGSAWDFQLYSGGIYDGECSSNPDDIDHAVLVVGYGSEGDQDYWIVKNSWGTSWGIDGYIYIRRNTNLAYGVCAINAMASYPTTKSASRYPTTPSDEIKSFTDYIKVIAEKRKIGKHKFPRTKGDETQRVYQSIASRRNQFAASA